LTLSEKRKEKIQCLVLQLGHPILGDYKYWDLGLQTGGISKVSGSDQRMTELARLSRNCTLQTSCQRGLQTSTKPQLTVIKIWYMGRSLTP
jgi:hypothetical protein